MALRRERKFLTFPIVITSKLTSKAQTTIPQSVRAALRLRKGDQLAYIIEADRVLLMRVASEVYDPLKTFTEWASEADAKAYAGL